MRSDLAKIVLSGSGNISRSYVILVLDPCLILFTLRIAQVPIATKPGYLIFRLSSSDLRQ